jgi:hypothetical protein
MYDPEHVCRSGYVTGSSCLQWEKATGGAAEAATPGYCKSERLARLDPDRLDVEILFQMLLA